MDKDEIIYGVPQVSAILQEELDTDSPTALKAQAGKCEAWQSRVSYKYRNAQRELSDMNRQYILPKSSAYTDMDRKINLEAAVSTKQCEVDILKDQQDMLQRRISLIQTLLKSAEQEMKSGLR